MRADAGQQHTRHGRYTRKLTGAQAQTACDLYRDGWTMQRIADWLGVSWQAVRYQLRKHNVTTRDRHAKTTDPVDRTARDEAGIIVTLRRQRDGVRVSLHVPGKRKAAIRYVATVLDHNADDWRLLCYSTPETVGADLRGDREPTEASPEVRALGTIGRRDLLDPSVAAKTNERNGGHY